MDHIGLQEPLQDGGMGPFHIVRGEIQPVICFILIHDGSPLDRFAALADSL
jgi:hypothetical protein